MSRPRAGFAVFQTHHKLLFVPLKEFIDRLNHGRPQNQKIVGGSNIFQDIQHFREFLTMIGEEFGGGFQDGLEDLPIRMINNRVRNWLISG